MREILKKGSFLNKIILLVSIGMPGVMKFIFALLLKMKYDLYVLGSYANDLNISLILVSITGTGFSVVIMNRIPKINDIIGQKKLLGSITFFALFVVLISSTVIYFLDNLGLIKNSYSVFIYLLGFTAYILNRSYLLARQEYLIVLSFEIVILLTVSSGLYFIKELNPLFVHGAILVLIFYISLLLKTKFRWIGISEIRSGFGFGISNLASSFLALISVPMTLQLLGPLYAGFLGLLNPIIQIIVLIPRTLSSYYLPLMSKYANYSKRQKESISIFFKYNTIFLCLVLSIVFICWLIYIYVYPNSDIVLKYSVVILLVLLLNLFFSQLSLPFFTALSSWDCSRKSLFVNMTMFLSFLAVLPLFSLLKENISGYCIVYSYLILMNIVRFYYLNLLVKRKLKAAYRE